MASPVQSIPTAVSADRVALVAEFLSMPTSLVESALVNVASKNAVLLVVSGKLASGKDTVAPELLERLQYDQRVHLYYALALKDEIDQIITEIRSYFSPIPGRLSPVGRTAFAEHIAARYNLPAASATLYAGALVDEVMADAAMTSRTRTSVMRQVLQHHGTNVRRAQDDNYWVKKSLRPAVEALAVGSSVYYTDARFPNEVDWALDCGAFAIRLDVSHRTQLDRLSSRDNLTAPDPASFTHESETALDDYTRFAVRLSNDGPLEDTLMFAEAAYAAV